MEMDVAWQELMSITELQELEAPGDGPFDAPQFQTYENLIHMGGYGSHAQPDPSCQPGGSYGGFSHLDVPRANTDATYGHADQQLGHVAPPFSSNPLMTPREHVTVPGLRVSLCPPPGLTQPLWTSQGAEDLESDSGLSLGSSPPLASPEVSGGVAAYHGMEMGGVCRDEVNPRAADSHYNVDFHHHAAPYPCYLAPQPGVAPQTLRMFKHHSPCDGLGTPSRRSAHTKSGASNPVPLSRDERRALALKIPFPLEKIVNLPVDDFNELLTQFTLTDSQLALVRDIRRRGKNKVAAQNCRKRKLESIIHLERELGQLQTQREHLAQEHREVQRSLTFLRCRLSDLYTQVFAHLRDENGRPYSMDEHSLQQTPDGMMYLVPVTRREPY